MEVSIYTVLWILFAIIIVAWYVHDKYVQRDHQLNEIQLDYLLQKN